MADVKRAAVLPKPIEKSSEEIKRFEESVQDKDAKYRKNEENVTALYNYAYSKSHAMGDVSSNDDLYTFALEQVNAEKTFNEFLTALNAKLQAAKEIKEAKEAFLKPAEAKPQELDTLLKQDAKYFEVHRDSYHVLSPEQQSLEVKKLFDKETELFNVCQQVDAKERGLFQSIIRVPSGDAQVLKEDAESFLEFRRKILEAEAKYLERVVGKKPPAQDASDKDKKDYAELVQKKSTIANVYVSPSGDVKIAENDKPRVFASTQSTGIFGREWMGLGGKTAKTEFDEAKTKAEEEYKAALRSHREGRIDAAFKNKPGYPSLAIRAHDLHREILHTTEGLGISIEKQKELASAGLLPPSAKISLTKAVRQSLKENKPDWSGLKPHTADEHWFRTALTDRYRDDYGGKLDEPDAPDNVRIGVKKQSDGSVSVELTHIKTTPLSAKKGDNNEDASYYMARGRCRYAHPSLEHPSEIGAYCGFFKWPEPGIWNTLKVVPSMIGFFTGVNYFMDKAEQARGERMQFAAHMGAEKDSRWPIDLKGYGGTGHEDLFKFRNERLQAIPPSDTISADVFVHVHRDLATVQDKGFWARLKSMGEAKEKENYQEWLIKSFTTIKSEKGQIADITNFTLKSYQQMNKKIANNEITSEERDQYMKEWMGKIKEQNPKLYAGMIVKMTKKMDSLYKEITTEAAASKKSGDALKLAALVAKAESVGGVLNAVGNTSCDHTLSSILQIDEVRKFKESCPGEKLSDDEERLLKDANVELPVLKA